jgi:DNA-binding PadR family transcriptional regulator
MGEAHGYGIIKEMRIRSDGYFDFKDGTVYPVLHRLEKQGYLRGSWQNPADGMNRRNYQITKKGRDVLRERTEAWRSFAAAMDLIFDDS